jgi:predicted phage terminase large subunit-like protein
MMNKSDKSLSESQEELLLFLQEARNDLLTFCQLMQSNFEVVWFHEVIASALTSAINAVQEKRKARIILTIPPRHGKSQLASIHFPAWALGKYPNLRFILSTYGSDLSQKVGQKARDEISNAKYQMIFPGIKLRQDTKAKARWMTNKGGEFNAVGVGSAVTGTGADVILIDDIHKDRAEAESETMRENAWEYYRSTLYSRLEGYGAVIVIMQRWHTDDLVGRLLEDAEHKKAAGEPYDEWEVINFPAIALDDEKYRKAGEPLWPNKFPIAVLENIRSTQGNYNWISQYQQDPILAETQEFKEDMFRYYNAEDIEHVYLRYYTIVDPAISQKQEADNTVVLTVAKEVNGPNVYRIREDAGHFTPKQTQDLVFKHHADFNSEVFIETVAYQKALKYNIEEEQRRRNTYFTVHEVKSTTNKEIKVRGGLLPMYENGVIFHKRTDREYEHELLAFPRGKHDDRIDAMAMVCTEALQNTRAGRAVKQYRQKVSSYFHKKY